MTARKAFTPVELRELAKEPYDFHHPHLLDALRSALLFCADVIDAANVALRQPSAAASPAPGRAPLSLEQQKSESVLVNAAARKLYNAYTDNHPTIHCNRFASWEELDAKERKEWIKKAGIAPAGGIGGEKP